jgi:hypothetical protein
MISMTTNNKSKQRVTLFLDPNLLKQAKMNALVEEISLAALVERLLIKHLPEEININKAKINIRRSA